MIRVATRASTLARWQAERVGARIGSDVEYVLVTTSGDRDQTSDLHAIGGVGVFTKEVQQAVLDGRADVAVHSAKDLPPVTPSGLLLAAIPERGDVRDALVGCRLAELPTGARVGTGSVRRRAQLAAARPDLTFGPLRGNIATRLRKRAEMGYEAVVVAYAALERLGLAAEATEVLEPEVLLPQVGQGALAVECRADDWQTTARLREIDDPARAPCRRCRAGVPRRAGRRLQSAVRCARDARRAGHDDRPRRVAGVARRSRGGAHLRRR